LKIGQYFAKSEDTHQSWRLTFLANRVYGIIALMLSAKYCKTSFTTRPYVMGYRVIKMSKSERLSIALHGDPSQSYGASPAIWDHIVLPATRHRWTCPTLTPAIQAGTWFTYPAGMEGWVDLGVGYVPRWFTCPQTFTHPGSNHLHCTLLFIV